MFFTKKYHDPKLDKMQNYTNNGEKKVFVKIYRYKNKI